MAVRGLLNAVVAVIVASSAVAGCATATRRPAERLFPLPAIERYEPAAVTEAQRLIAAGGRTLAGKKALVVHGVSYPLDCTGLVRAAYGFASIDLAYRFDEYAGNGVRRLYETLRDDGLLYAVRYPTPADLIFWDDTYDADGDGRPGDELTHVGVVLAVEPDGSVEYLHYHYRLGPVIERMNLTRPDDPSNATLRMRGSPDGPGTNAAQLFRVFGKGYELKAP